MLEEFPQIREDMQFKKREKVRNKYGLEAMLDPETLQQPHERVVAAGIVPTGNKDASLILAAGGLGAFLILRGRGSKLVKEMLKTAPTTDAAKFATEAEAKLMEQATAKFGEADSAAKRAFLSKQRQHIRSAESDIQDVMKRFFDGSTTDDENEFIRAAVIREKTELRDKAWAEYTKDWTPEQKAKWATVEERASSTFTTNIRGEDVTFKHEEREREGEEKRDTWRTHPLKNDRFRYWH
jgi:hypothetical protein